MRRLLSCPLPRPPGVARAGSTLSVSPDGITIKTTAATRATEVSTEFAGRRLSLETGRIAGMAGGAVLARYGNTSVLATVVSEWTDAPPEDGGTPLQVDYQEKYFASGHIPATHTRREMAYGPPCVCRLCMRVVAIATRGSRAGWWPGRDRDAA